MRRNKKYFAAVLFIAALISIGAIAFSKNPSKTLDGKEALKYAIELEKNPFSKDAKDMRTRVFDYLSATEDFSISLCSDVIGPLLEDKKNPQQPLLSTQILYSMCRFVLENPDKKDDKLAYHIGGIEGLMKVYAIVLAKDPAAKSLFLDDLIEKQKRGELKSWMETQLTKCK